MKTCQVKVIPEAKSLDIARSIRSDNVQSLVQGPGMEASIVNRKCWQPGQTISISFLNGSDTDKAFIKETASEWTKIANLKFDWIESGGMVRIKRSINGSWSYMGTDCLGVNAGETMEFGWVDRSVVLHEFGHMLGLNHSHNSLNFPYHFNEDVVIPELKGPPNNWNMNTIRSNVLDKTREGVTETTWSPKQVMNYYCPARWIVEGVEISPGEDIGDEERELIAKIYGKAGEERTGERITIGKQTNGRGSREYQLVIEKRGIYTIRKSPFNVKVKVNGTLANTISLNPGTYRLNVEAKSNFSIVVRRM